MALVEMGEGPAVVLLHGIPESWRCWRQQMSALSRQFRVIAPDLKGYGQSDKSEGDYSGSNVARETVRFLDHLGVDSFHLAGRDWGVMFAAAYHCTTLMRAIRCITNGMA